MMFTTGYTLQPPNYNKSVWTKCLNKQVISYQSDFKAKDKVLKTTKILSYYESCRLVNPIKNHIVNSTLSHNKINAWSINVIA